MVVRQDVVDLVRDAEIVLLAIMDVLVAVLQVVLRTALSAVLIVKVVRVAVVHVQVAVVHAPVVAMAVQAVMVAQVAAVIVQVVMVAPVLAMDSVHPVLVAVRVVGAIVFALHHAQVIVHLGVIPGVVLVRLHNLSKC